MIDHVSLGSHRFPEAIRFYSICFTLLGYSLEHRTDLEAAFGSPGHRHFWLYRVDGDAAIRGQRTHVAVSAMGKEKVHAFFDAALERGAVAVRQPGPRPDISPDYYGTVIKDLDGHTIEVVHWAREETRPTTGFLNKDGFSI